MPLLQCVVVTPEKTLRDTPAEFVALPLVDGEIGIAPSHSPLIGRLGCGEMRITEKAGVVSFYIEGGFVEVLGNTVSVLTNRVIPSKELNETGARELLRSAQQKPANTAELMAIRDRATLQARTQVHLARKMAK